jgi:hypothetical protein
LALEAAKAADEAASETPGWHAATAANATQPSSYLDNADQPEDYQNDDDHADDSYATAHRDLLFTNLVDEALKTPARGTVHPERR